MLVLGIFVQHCHSCSHIWLWEGDGVLWRVRGPATVPINPTALWRSLDYIEPRTNSVLIWAKQVEMYSLNQVSKLKFSRMWFGLLRNSREVARTIFQPEDIEYEHFNVLGWVKIIQDKCLYVILKYRVISSSFYISFCTHLFKWNMRWNMGQASERQDNLSNAHAVNSPHAVP